MKSQYKKIEIRGNAHFSARGDLESKMWNWGLYINGKFVTEDNFLQMRTPEARAFYGEIKPYLPKLNRYDMVPPDRIPGGSWIFRMPLERMKHPGKVEKILRKYFPKSFI